MVFARLPLFTLIGLVTSGSGSVTAQSADADRFFETRVRPVLVERCFGCHGPESKMRGGLRVDSREALLKGGGRGPALVPGQPEDSLLVRALRHDGELQMPPRTKLPPREIADLTTWVRLGAPWPGSRAAVVSKAAGDAPAAITPEQRSFWAFQPPRRPALPTVRDAGWVRSPVDAFVLAGLETKGLTPAPAADRRTLIRRATFDLTGLPPTPAEVDAFLADCSPAAFARVVDRLLASPAYGEKWGRHWLDLARYADSNGMDENLAQASAWRYRDYVIRAFNTDTPFDRFVREQLAGDLLPGPTAEQIVATGFLSLGPKMLAEDDPVKMEMDIVDEQVDTIGRTFLGLTLGCARCHDHKFDPVPTADYYALAGIFKSTRTMDHFKVVARWHERPLDSKPPAPPGKDEPERPAAMAVEDGAVTDLRVHLRGSHLTLGRTVPRGFPRVLAGDRQPSLPPRQSGRLQLAEWLTRPDHPLTARVLVNRVWQWHTGHGLVRTPDNFGRLGERPDNQPLLDWLALRFVADGWSVKKLHRRIMLSSTYQIGSAYDDRAAQVDPENRLRWRWDRRRLDAEEVRDALLAVGGTLDRTAGGSLLEGKNRTYVIGYPNARYARYDSHRRSVYLPVLRSDLYAVFQAFDFADPSTSSGRRPTTTVAPQALFMLNDKLVREQAGALAQDLLARADRDDAGRIRLAYERAYARPPRDAETARALAFARAEEQSLAGAVGDPAERRRRAWESLCWALLAANEFLYVD